MNDIHMETAATNHAMNRLDAAGADLTGSWTAAAAAIGASAGQLGKGVLGQAFLQGYQAHADALAAAAATCTQIPGQLAVSGHQSVDDYVATDGAGADEFR